MKKSCAHCGKPFESQRSSRLYCSDNCKQLAYYKRNGLILSSSKTAYAPLMDDYNVKDVNGVKDVKDDRSMPDSFTERLNAFIEEEIARRIAQRSEHSTQAIVKDGVNVKPHFTVNDNYKNTPSARLAKETTQQNSFTIKDNRAGGDNLNVKDIATVKQSFTSNAKADSIDHAGAEQKNSESDTSNTVTVRDHKLADDDINVKDSAIAKQSFTLNAKPDPLAGIGAEQNSNNDSSDSITLKGHKLSVKDTVVKPSFTPDDLESNASSDIDELEREAEILQDELLSDINDPMEEETKDNDEMKTTDNKSEAKENNNPVNTEQFKWFHSSFNACIHHGVSFSDEILEYSKVASGAKVLEVFKCLVKQLLLLSNRNEISRTSLVVLSNTFYMLVNSKEFRSLPKSFPYNAKIKKLQDKIRSFAQSTADDESVKLQLPTEQRAGFFTILLEMGDSVKDVKFGEIGFKNEAKQTSVSE